MAGETGIEWCDSTFNPWIGCTQVSPACDHCYAEVATPSRTLGVVWGAGKPRYRTSAANWKLPLRWNSRPFEECSDCGWRGEKHPTHNFCPRCGGEQLVPTRQRVFCASLSDWLDNEVPVEWLVDLLDLIRRTPNIDWLLLTKRIGNWRSRIQAAIFQKNYISQELATWLGEWHDGKRSPANVWIGATICNQAEADRDVPKLLRVAAAVRFLSIEPMLGPINLKRAMWSCVGCGGCHQWGGDPRMSTRGVCHECKRTELEIRRDHGFFRTSEMPRIDWVIAGGESGPHARDGETEWYRQLAQQCKQAGVPFHLKQITVGGKKLPMGVWPSDLQVQEFPR